MNETRQDKNARRRVIVFVEQDPNALAQITEALGKANVNIEAIDGRMAGDFGVISLGTNDDDAALLALLEVNFRAVTSEAVVFHLDDKPGALAAAARLFSEHKLNVRTIHILHRHAGHAIVAVTTDDDDLARTLIGDASLV